MCVCVCVCVVLSISVMENSRQTTSTKTKSKFLCLSCGWLFPARYLAISSRSRPRKPGFESHQRFLFCRLGNDRLFQIFFHLILRSLIEDRTVKEWNFWTLAKLNLEAFFYCLYRLKDDIVNKFCLLRSTEVNLINCIPSLVQGRYFQSNWYRSIDWQNTRPAFFIETM